VETGHGRTLHASDLATLHRWIIERRVTREDRIARGGQGFQRIADVPDLAPFFDIADSAERARRADTPAPRTLPGLPPAATLPAAAAPPASASRAALADPDEPTLTKKPRKGPFHVSLALKLMLTTLVATLVAYSGIALQQWHARSQASLPEAPPVQPAHPAPPTATPPPPAAEIEPLAPAAEPEAETEAADEAEPAPIPSVTHRKARLARAASARPAKAAAPAPVRTKNGPAAASGPSPQIAAAQGYAALNRRQLPQAIELFKQALAGNPSNGTALFGLGEAYRESGQKAAALKAYRRYVQILPSGPDAGRARLQIRQLEGKAK
jgi:tetratricopeptide (TPR) repeat protein